MLPTTSHPKAFNFNFNGLGIICFLKFAFARRMLDRKRCDLLCLKIARRIKKKYNKEVMSNNAQKLDLLSIVTHYMGRLDQHFFYQVEIVLALLLTLLETLRMADFSTFQSNV